MRGLAFFVAGALLTMPAHVIAQDVIADPGVAAAAVGLTEDDEGNSRLGLLGLLGLAGLLGLIRREPDIHVDARGDKRR